MSSLREGLVLSWRRLVLTLACVKLISVLTGSRCWLTEIDYGTRRLVHAIVALDLLLDKLPSVHVTKARAIGGFMRLFIS